MSTAVTIPARRALFRRVNVRCQQVLEGNWREGEQRGTAYAYTSPSPGKYPWQWYWDSCFAAIVQRHIHPERSRKELESLLAAADDQGFIGHTIFWNSKVSLSRFPFYNVMKRSDAMTKTIQPPMLAWAWSIAVGDPAHVPAIVKHHATVEKQRDLQGNGLIWIIQPDESGLDASPQFDPVWGKQANGRFGFVRLVATNRKMAFDPQKLLKAGRPVVLEPMTNTLHALSKLALGQPSVTPNIVKEMWDSEQGLFVLRSNPPLSAPPPVTWAGLAPLALPDLPEAIGRVLVERHLQNPDSFKTLLCPPSVALNDPAYAESDHRMGLRQYWRGPTWVNSAWMVWMGLRRLGYDDLADSMTAAIAEAVDREGLREYYHPSTGKGMGARDFAWSTLIIDMIKNDPRARTSYIPQHLLPPLQSKVPPVASSGFPFVA